MAESSSRPNLKRPLPLDDDDDLASKKSPMQKRVRFPKGKKVKPGEEKVEIARAEPAEDSPLPLSDPRRAAKERAKRRGDLNSAIFNDDGKGLVDDVTTAEATYEDYETFYDDGVQIEPFSLNKEREEGYFDANMNYVEYVKEKETKDAWLDSIEADPKYADKAPVLSTNDDEVEDQELTSEDIGKIKRRIADMLEPDETVLQALRRLKGNSNNRKDKMSSETKSKFDQLTEDAVKLLENGEYDVYQEKKESFQREAEGYESLARLRGEALSAMASMENDPGKVIPSAVTEAGVGSSASTNPPSDSFDMFADDEEEDNTDKTAVPGPSSDGVDLPNIENSNSESGTSQSDYVYDESSGYYYSSSLGYYYDPSTRLYCSSASGQWYSFNEETGTYDEVQATTTNAE